MGAERYTAAAVNADEGLARGVKINSVNRAGLRAGAAAGTELLFNNNTAAFSLGIRAGGAGGSAGRRIAGKADLFFKAR